MNTDSIVDAATQAGLGAYSEFIRQATKETVDVRIVSGTAGLLESRFGGAPALPPGFEWPKHDLGRYQFLGQINFSEIESAPPPLPSSGLLSLFFATDPDGEIFWGDPGYVLGYYFHDVADLVPQASPEEPDPHVCKIALESSVGLPSSPDLKLEYPFSGEDEDRFFYELPEKINAPTDYLLGYPSFNTLAYDPTPEGDWISLITLRSHEQLDWCWHDGDKLMVFIERQKLEGRDFSNLNCDAG